MVAIICIGKTGILLFFLGCEDVFFSCLDQERCPCKSESFKEHNKTVNTTKERDIYLAMEVYNH